MSPSGVSYVAAAIAALASTGCMSAAVFDYRGDDPPPTAPQTLQAAVAVNDLAVPTMRTEIIGPNTTPSARFGDARFDALEERLVQLLEGSRMVTQVRPARYLSREGIPSPGFVVQYSVQSYATSSSPDAGGVFAGIMGTILTAGLTGGAFVFMATTRHEHHFQVEVRLYRAEDSQLVSVRAARSGELVAQYDTAGAELIWRTTKQLTIRSGHCQVCVPGGAEAEAFHRQEGMQMARVIFEQTTPELHAQMRNALGAGAPPQMVHIAPSTSGGESPTVAAPEAVGGVFEETVRARLNERASRILLCANSDAAAVVVEWTGPGPVTMSIRDANAETTGCVRAAVGDLTAPPGARAGRVLHVVSR